ncbi:MAG: ErfK/YbiS/YcfS/YnhG family protein [Bacteroidota bacterium]|jgi:murein L,D-transpeptidase YafK|nr:ErfK/YbiS/YcfS/YnhG family protein [Bacteroidota bacterium]
MYRLLASTIICLLFFHSLYGQTFRETQKKYPRVRTAYTEKWEPLRQELESKGFKGPFNMMIRALKHEKKLEVWLKPNNGSAFRLFKSYDICYYSGELGPKRHQGDGQVPEGFYSIAVFNPYSNYHLSLGISYPNSSDRIMGKTNLGGDIMIHGNCVSIGCIPLTDKFIKEVYILAVEARSGGQSTIPVWIFPGKMDGDFLHELNNKYNQDPELISFWSNLKTGYDIFEKTKQLPKVTADKKGKYVFQ